MDCYQEELDRPRLTPGYHSEANYTALDLRSRRALDTRLFRIVQVAAAKRFPHTPDIFVNHVLERLRCISVRPHVSLFVSNCARCV